MSTTRFAIAAASLALMSAGASAQVSFESRGYGGPLGIGPNFQLGGQHSPPVYGGQERSNSTERYRAPQRIDRVQRKRDTDDDVKTAKKTPATEESKEATARNENSSIVSIASEKDKALPAPAVTEQRKTDVAKSDRSKSSNENSAIAGIASSATAKADPVKAEVTKADTDGGAKTVATCKRYFPTAGQTFTVPCD
jgi:hypothetical protein